MTATIEEELRAIVGAEHVRAGGPGDFVGGILPRAVVEPGNEEELARVLKLAREAGLAVIPRGGGTKVHWGNAPTRADLILSTARMDRVIEHAWADLTVSVEAGCTLQKLQGELAKHGQRLAVDPLWPERATIGGVLSTNDSGALRLRFGGLRDLVIGVTLALSDGTLAKSGGKVVKNVAGYDLPKLATGAYGTLGIITQATFRLHPVAQNSQTISFVAGGATEAQKLILDLQDSQLAQVALQGRFADDSAAEVDILFEGTAAGIAAQNGQAEKIAGNIGGTRANPNVWKAREELWASAGQDSVIAKISVPPADISNTVSRIADLAKASQLGWRSVIQATGIGWVRMDGEAADLLTGVRALRTELERARGSLALLSRPTALAGVDTWGEAGDALPLMRVLKRNFDPKNTLNPGRFVGGI
jgi:glycolate oxidase FAD binding subunit